jgi:hypothetical protein
MSILFILFSSCVSSNAKYQTDPLNFVDFLSFTSKTVLDKTEYPSLVVYYIRELNISLKVPGQANVIFENGFYKGGNKIDRIPQLWEKIIEAKRSKGVVFFAFDFGLNFEIYKNKENFNPPHDFSESTDVNEIIDALNNDYIYEFCTVYENQNNLIFFKFRYSTDKTNGITYYTIVENKGIQINFQASKEDLDIKIIDTIEIVPNP